MEIDENADSNKRKASTEQDAAAKRKRVSRACDRCRTKKGAALERENLFVEADVMISKTNVTDSVQAVQLVAPRARSARMIPARRSEVFPRDMSEDWRNSGRSRLGKSKILRARSPLS